MSDLGHDIKMILLVAVLIVFVFIACIVLGFLISTYWGLGATFRPPTVGGSQLLYQPINRHNFNDPTLYYQK